VMRARSASSAPTFVPMHRLRNIIGAETSACASKLASDTRPMVPGTSSRNAGWNETVAGMAMVSLSSTRAATKSTAPVTPMATMLPTHGLNSASTA